MGNQLESQEIETSTGFMDAFGKFLYDQTFLFGRCNRIVYNYIYL